MLFRVVKKKNRKILTSCFLLTASVCLVSSILWCFIFIFVFIYLCQPTQTDDLEILGQANFSLEHNLQVVAPNVVLEQWKHQVFASVFESWHKYVLKVQRL